MQLFSDLGIKDTLKESLHSLGFTHMKDVQAITIPHILANKDVIVHSQTGSGKTLAYLVPLLNMVSGNRHTMRILIIVPTRELCSQVSNVIRQLGYRSEWFIGGQPIEDDLLRLDEEICIGTPGRIMELIAQHPSKFKDIKWLVVDECDKLLDIGFESKLRAIINQLPKKRVTCMLSATCGDNIIGLGRFALKSPVVVRVNENIPEKLKLRYVMVEPANKIDTFLKLINGKKAIVFFSTCAQVEMMHTILTKFKNQEKIVQEKTDQEKTDQEQSVQEKIAQEKIVQEKTDQEKIVQEKTDQEKTDQEQSVQEQTDQEKIVQEKIVQEQTVQEQTVQEKIVQEQSAQEKTDQDKLEIEANNSELLCGINWLKSTEIHKIHGKMDQPTRGKIYEEFELKKGILLCTDLAARGIDFKGVNLVVHFDVPKDYQDIVHRSGRTARNNGVGESVLFLMENEKLYVDFLKLKDISIEKITLQTLKSDFLKILNELADDEFMKLAVRAFVSYIRSYKEHIVNYILAYKELNYDGLARLFFLRKIPSMPELKNVKFAGFEHKINENKAARNTTIKNVKKGNENKAKQKNNINKKKSNLGQTKRYRK